MITGEKLTVKLNDNDNVATALKDLDIGDTTKILKVFTKYQKVIKLL